MRAGVNGWGGGAIGHVETMGLGPWPVPRIVHPVKHIVSAVWHGPLTHKQETGQAAANECHNCVPFVRLPPPLPEGQRLALL